MLFTSACLPRGVPVEESPLLAALERKSGRIAYVGLDRNVYTVNQGGGNQTMITDDAQLPESDGSGPIRIYQFPNWSPNSESLAFISLNGDNGAPTAAALYTTAADGSSELTEIFTSETQAPLYLHWSPDGTNVSFLSSAPSGNMLLQMAPAQGDSNAQILDAGQPLYWSWSPGGGRMMVHIGGTTSQARLSFLNMQEQIIEEWIELQPSFFQAPAWSPDGSQLLVAATIEEGENTLLLTDNKGAIQEELVQLGDDSVAFAWSPNGRKIAYITTNRAEQQNILGSLTVLDPEQPDNRFTIEEDQVAAFFWSPDSKQIAYLVPRSIRDPNSNTQEDEEPAQLLLVELFIMDVDNESSQRVAVFQPTSEFLSILPFFDQYQQSATIWSPNSAYVVITGTAGEGGAPQVWVVDALGNLDPRPITPGVVAFWSWE